MISNEEIINENRLRYALDQEEVFLTEAGKSLALNRLEFLRTVKRAEVNQYLSEAKKARDIIDLATYEDAKKEHEHLEARIQELEKLISRAKAVVYAAPTDTVSLGYIIHLRTDDGNEYRYRIVGPFEADPRKGLISSESPVGKALLGHKIGQQVIASSPGGKKTYTILDIDGEGQKDLTPPVVESKRNRETIIVRITEEPLTPHNLTSILLAITELSTKCWLIGKGRFGDLIEYTQTHDVRFVEETQLAFTKITYNSPFDATIKISASDIAQAIGITIDGVTQAKARLEKAELENKVLVQTIEHSKQKIDQENKTAFLEQEKQELAIERERLEILEKRLDVQKKGIEYALEIANKTVNMLQPNADEQTKAMAIQILLPTLLQINNGKGLELVLPAPQSQNDEEKK